MFTVFVLALFGVILGSFVNAFVWRLHESEEIREKIELLKKQPKRVDVLRKRLRMLSISRGRSICPHCEHVLAAKDLIPIVSWISLRGKCRYCRKPISWQYPLVELLTGALFAVSYLCWPERLSGVWLFAFVCWLFYLIVFVCLAVYDLRWFLLPNKVVLPLILAALAQVLVVSVWQQDWNALWGPVAGGAIIFGLFYLLFQISGGKWIGGGDVKIAFALGLIAGSPVNAFLVIFFASLLGTLVSIPLLARGKEALRVRIPFGPYLLGATIIVVLFGSNIVSWYTNFFLPGL